MRVVAHCIGLVGFRNAGGFPVISAEHASIASGRIMPIAVFVRNENENVDIDDGNDDGLVIVNFPSVVPRFSAAIPNLRSLSVFVVLARTSSRCLLVCALRVQKREGTSAPHRKNKRIIEKGALTERKQLLGKILLFYPVPGYARNNSSNFMFCSAFAQ